MPAILKKAANVARVRRGRLQVGALPYRRGPDGNYEILLVTTRGTGRWMVPKGWPMAGKSHAEAAAQEAYEEAGVRGRADPVQIGRFEHEKSLFPSGSIHGTVAVFAMPVEQELARWPERGQRTRRWFPLDEAAEAVHSPALGKIISGLKQRGA